MTHFFLLGLSLSIVPQPLLLSLTCMFLCTQWFPFACWILRSPFCFILCLFLLFSFVLQNRCEFCIDQKNQQTFMCMSHSQTIESKPRTRIRKWPEIGPKERQRRVTCAVVRFAICKSSQFCEVEKFPSALANFHWYQPNLSETSSTTTSSSIILYRFCSELSSKFKCIPPSPVARLQTVSNFFYTFR